MTALQAALGEPGREVRNAAIAIAERVATPYEPNTLLEVGVALTLYVMRRGVWYYGYAMRTTEEWQSACTAT